MDHILQLQVQTALQHDVNLQTVPVLYNAQLGKTVGPSEGGIYDEYRFFLPPKNRFR